MDNKFVYIKRVEIYDKKVFTQERVMEWENHIYDSYECILNEIKKKIAPESMVRFFISNSLVDEVLIDAIIGMRKIIDSKYNDIENPNAFKVAAYITYWWLRHKPVCIHYRRDFSLDEVAIMTDESKTAEENEYERLKLIWQLKHINEIVAVQIAMTYIFDFNKELCGTIKCNVLKFREKENFCFESFEEMQETILRKLTYYFAYRTVAPKVIEHLLEGYTFHPTWGLTGSQWAAAKQE